MKKIVILGSALLMACGVLLAAQENASPIQFAAWGKAVWAPFVWRGRGDPDYINEDRNTEAGMGTGAGPMYGDTPGATLGLDVRGKDPSDSIGFEFRMRVRPGKEGTNSWPTLFANDNMAYVWTKPAGDVLDMRFGMYQWDELRGKIGGVGEIVGSYGGGEDDIFQRVESDTFGALFIIKPLSLVSDVGELTVFGSFGVTGGIDITAVDNFAAMAKDGLKYIFSTPHAGIAYRHEAFGLARFQFIGSNYMWGNGDDWNNRTVSYPWYGTSTPTHWWFPARVREQAQLELAVNLDFIPGLNVDLGFSYPLQVTVANEDGSTAPRVNIGPRYGDLGAREPDTYSNREKRLADKEGDVWQPPLRVALGVDWKPDFMNLGLRFRAKMEFGEEVAFADGVSDNYKGGMRLEFGLEPSYTFDRIGTVSLDAALRFRENDSYNGKADAGYFENGKAINSINHNGRIDLGLGAFFTRRFANWGYIKTGFCATLPLGGDRYEWSTDSIKDFTEYDSSALAFFSAKSTEAYKQLNLVFAIPIILEVSLR